MQRMNHSEALIGALCVLVAMTAHVFAAAGPGVPASEVKRTRPDPLDQRETTLGTYDATTQRANTSTTRAGLIGGSPTTEPAGRSVGLIQLSEHLSVYYGAINVGIVCAGDKCLLIDCGDASVAGELPRLGVTSVDQILFTHHHRDQACGADTLIARKARVGVPARERGYFDNVGAYWNEPKNRWHVYEMRPHHLMLAESIRVDAAYNEGDVLSWGPARIRVLATPGHTDGSVSYLVEADGRKVIFSGDTIYSEGRLWDIYSLQKGYHGFLGARTELVASLRRIKDTEAEVLVPSHGPIITDPPKAIEVLVQRLEACYEQYVSISGFRYYASTLFTEYADRKSYMPFGKSKPAPSCLRHDDTTWTIVSRDKAAFVVDCGSPAVVQTLRKLVDENQIRTVEGLWVTHYHEDHTDGIAEFQKVFDCPTVIDSEVAQVVRDPSAWRLPCLSPGRCRVDRTLTDRESWPWHEFTMTSYHFPGQTLYHAALLVEGQGVRMLFVGDSFSPSGIDDYCTGNRNWLGRGVGFDRCIALIEKLKPTHLLSSHVSGAYEFTPEQYRFMKDNLDRREKLFGELVPWDDANYGLDESWVRCHPYGQKAKAGDQIVIRVIATNHSTEQNSFACRAALPRGWAPRNVSAGGHAQSRPAADTGWARHNVAAGVDDEVTIVVDVPVNASPGRYIVPIDVQYGSWSLPQFTECVVVLE